MHTSELEIKLDCIAYKFISKTQLEIIKYTHEREKSIAHWKIRIQETFYIFWGEKFMKPVNQFVGSYNIKRIPNYEN